MGTLRHIHVLFFIFSLACPVALVLKEARGGSKWRERLHNNADLQYYGQANVGGQRLHSVIDTGSVKLVILSDACNFWCGKKSHLFHPKRSKTYWTGAASTTLSYGSGDLVGRRAFDTVQIGPLKPSGPLPFWEIIDANMPLLEYSNFAIILGLGPIKPNGKSELMPALGVRSFSICLLQEPLAPGYIIWNDDSVNTMPKLFMQISLVDSGYWLAKLKNIRLGDSEVFACKDMCGAIIDSGTSLLAVPNDSYEWLRKAISKFGPDCSDIKHMPHLVFELDGKEIRLPPDSYLGDVRGDVHQALYRNFQKRARRTGRKNDTCQDALMHVGMTSSLGPTWILGMPFLRNYYTVFVADEKPKMYVARANRQCNPTTDKALEAVGDREKNGKIPARVIDLSKLRLMPWVESVMNYGELAENASHSSLRSKKV